MSVGILDLSAKNASFTSTIEGKAMLFTVLYNRRNDGYSLSIFDLVDNVPVLDGISLVSGVDIVRQHGKEIGAFLMIGDGTDPAKLTLGVTNKLVIASESEKIYG